MDPAERLLGSTLSSTSHFVHREHTLFVSETSNWPRLTASNAVNCHFLQVSNTYSAADLRIRDMGCHELTCQLYIIPLYQWHVEIEKCVDVQPYNLCDGAAL